jgi:hypothetical protein
MKEELLRMGLDEEVSRIEGDSKKLDIEGDDGEQLETALTRIK